MSTPSPEECERRPSLTVVIATHNNVDVLRRCLASWERHGPAGDIELLVVADGCTDGTSEYLHAVHATPWGSAIVRWVEEADVHELRCTNRGLHEARGALVMSWHDDMFLERSWLVPEIIATFGAYPDIGVVSLSRGLLCSPLEAPITTWEDSVDWRRVQSTIGGTPLNWVRLVEVDAVVRPWVVRRACVEHVGPLDEAFGLTEWDEADLCFRIRDAGWRIATHGYERDGAYTHLLSSTYGRSPDSARQAIGLRNALLFHSRWGNQIVREHPRSRRTWRRRMALRGAANLAPALLAAIAARVSHVSARLRGATQGAA